ncbi:L-lactate dehydrogenase complex protein LldG [Kaistia hirudinis]|uniref:L-lactate dehydrogenase complex protein LldG n=1 Tax=Kaistia hirudinis TaxID=1293440 RepID=A0A840AN07_9HYPH|nr:LUD domain-containing protein [Kaistia hirudinis]MBB3930427.1 L-lactate dehydrogenase complex protein LldG [Kaistia hirudinis]
MNGREAVLSRVRQSLGVTGKEESRRREVAERLADVPRGVIPARGQLPDEERIALFMKQADKALATIERVPSAELVPEAIAMYLRSKNLPAELKRGEDPRLAALPWERAPQLAISTGPTGGRDLVGVSHAGAGVAETGTIVMLSGPENPSTLNFLPDYHIVVLSAGDITGDYETAFDKVRAQYGAGVMPRTVNFITGPSRSGDIEQKLLLGAHGPRSLHILVVG